MNKTAINGVLLIALGIAVGGALGWRGAHGRDASVDDDAGRSVSAATQRSGAGATASRDDQRSARLERQLEILAAKLDAEAERRRRLEARLEVLDGQLTALRGSAPETVEEAAAKPEAAAAAPSVAAAPASGEESVTSMEHALVAAGIDAPTATEIRRRRDALTLSEIYLRDQATREGWLDTPDFAAKMAEIDQQRTSIRDEIGDDAYDRYLAALEHPNRVAVNEVMLDSPAAAAGLQAGDVVLRYGDTRIFDPGELVTATRGGTAGEPVQLEIIRQGQRLEINVPRGPLGVSIAASRGNPGES